MAFPTGWTRYCPLVIQHGKVGANQTLAVVFTEASLPAEMLTTGNSHQAQADGGDIRFTTDTAGAAQLACEVVFWSKNANPLLAKAEVWVPVAVSSSVDTTVYVWYSAGGSEVQPAVGAAFGRNAVWDSGYQGGVAHFPNGTVLTITDSTGHNTFVNSSGLNPVSAAAGVVDGAVSGAPASPPQAVDIGLLPTVFDGVSTVLTIEMWIYSRQPTVSNKSDGVCASSRTGNNTVRMIFGQDGGTANKIQLVVNTGSWGAVNFRYVQSTATTISATTWFHVVCLLDVATVGNSLIYVNGSSVTSNNGTLGSPLSVLPTPLPSNAHLFLQDGGEQFDGQIDEYRMSNVSRSATYVSTTYNNQFSPSTFAIAGTPVTPGGGGGAKGNPLSGVNPIQGFLS